MILEKPGLLGHHVLLRARIWHVVHGGKWERGCQNITTLSVEYSRERSKTVLESGPAMSPSGNTRPREHDTSPNTRFLASDPLRSLAEKSVREHQASGA